MLRTPHRAPKGGVVRRVAQGLMLTASLIVAAPTSAFACTQVWMPDAYTAEDGVRYFGRAEDSYSRYVKVFGIEEASNESVTYSSDEGSFEWTSPKGYSYRYTYVRDLPEEWDGCTDAYSEAGINEMGVSCSATLTTYANEKIVGGGHWAKDENGNYVRDENGYYVWVVDVEGNDENPDGGIGEYNYASVVLGEAATAREGVELIGEIIDDKGAYSTDQLIISDANETWLVDVLSGTQWIAFKMPEDKVSMNPNISNLYFDLGFTIDEDGNIIDDGGSLHSDRIIEVAQEAGTLKYFDEEAGIVNIAGSYGEDITETSSSSWTRYFQGRAYFGANAVAGQDYTYNEVGSALAAQKQPLFYVPARADYTTFDAIRALAARGEQTEDLNANENEDLYAVGNDWMLESHIFEIRDGLDPEIATVQWEALSRSEFSVAVPIYSALITEVSPYFGDINTDTNDHAITITEVYDEETDEFVGYDYSYDDVVETALEEEPENSLDYVLMDINTLCTLYRDQTAASTREYLDALQKDLIAQHEEVAAAMEKVSEEDRTTLANQAEFAAAEQTYTKAKQVLTELRAYVSEGLEDETVFESEFVPTAYVAGNYAEKALEGIEIPAEVEEPEVPGNTEQPGTETPGTEQPGNEQQTPAETEDPTATEKPATKPSGKTNTKGSLPATGDSTFVLATSAVVAAAACAGGAVTIRRRRASK